MKGDRSRHLGAARVPTTDDWYPTAADGCVRLRIMQLRDGCYRICYWGEDDFGMEFDTFDREEHEAMVRRLPSVVTVAALRELGFVRA